MKRFLVGVSVLGSMVGFGSVGVYYARQKLAPAVEAGTDSMLAQNEAVEESPTPIPVRPVDTMQQSAGNERGADPYANQTAERYQTERPRMIEDDPSATEIPRNRVAAADDEGQAVRSSSPFAARRMPAVESRYAEQTAAAEVAADAEDTADQASQEEPAEAQDAAEARLMAGRYERRAAARELPEDEPAADEEPDAAQEQPAEPEAADEPAAEQPAREAPAEEPATPAHNEGTGRPGDPQLSGSQAPALTIEKLAPPEIQLGKLAKFVIKVKNNGTATAQGVEIHDTIPEGTQLLDTHPAAKRGPNGALVWELGALKPGDEQTVELNLMPTAEGEIGSVATVHFRAEASVRTLATKPMLNIEVHGPSKVLKGEQVALRIKLSNPGSGAAQNVVLTENVPDGLSHPSGKELEFEVGTLKPGEARELDLTLVAAVAGPITNIVTAEGDANLKAEARAELEVVAPQLQVSLTGPKKRYLERNATHQISVTNPGTAAAKDIELVAVIPRTLKFVSANNGGQFDEATQSVYWALEELPPQETGTVTLTTLPLEAGESKLTIKGLSKSGLKAERDETLSIEGLAAINFQLSDVRDPIEAGAETAYEIRVTNQGSKAANNVRVTAMLPRGMKAVNAEGPVRYKIEGQRVTFEPIRQLAAKADTSFTLKVKAEQSGDLRVQVQIVTDEIRDPITREESTRVFGDE